MKQMLTILGITAILGTGLSASEGSDLYKKCVACHGVDGKKSALGKSNFIGGVGSDIILADLRGYKEGTLNKKGMGGLMSGQVKNTTDKQLNTLSVYISQLK